MRFVALGKPDYTRSAMTAPALGFDAQAIESHTSIENHRRLGQVASSVNSHFPLTLGGLPAKFWVDQYLWDDCVVFVHPDIAIWMVEQQADSEKRFHILRDPQPFLPSDLKSLPGEICSKWSEDVCPAPIAW